MDEENHFEIYNLAIHPFRGILLTVDEVSPEQMRLLLFQIYISTKIQEYGLVTDIDWKHSYGIIVRTSHFGEVFT